MNIQEIEIFDFYPPQNNFIGIISIPHSGEIIPKEFDEYLIEDKIILSRDVDTAVDKLIDIKELNNNGIAVIKSNIHRICVDLNRSFEDCVLNWKKNSHGEKTVRKSLTLEEENLLALKYHAPYFEMLKSIINQLKKQYPKASFIDLHSMPSRATEYHLKITPNQSIIRPDFCLSDVNSITCEEVFIKTFQKELTYNYSKVTINDPYFGGFITRHINDLFPEINNIQIEINRALYLNEENRQLINKAQDLKINLTRALLNSFNKFS